MTQQRLLRAVDQVGDRVLRLRAWRWRTACWFGLAILACVLIAARRWFGADISSNMIIGVLAGGVLLSFIFQAFTLRRQPSLETARQIESTHPGLNDALLAAMEQQPEEPGGQLRYLQTRVIDKAVSHSTYSSWQDVVPNGRLKGWMLAGITSLVLFLTCTIFAFERPANALLGPPAPVPVKTADGTIYGIIVEPGDTELERGTSLLVMARFEGQLPSEANLDLKTGEGDTQRFQMAPGVDSNLFLARVPSISDSGTYQIQYDDELTPEFKVSVFTVPALEQADAHITYPNYTNIEKKIVQDTRRVSVVQGSTVQWLFRLNKDVASAELRAEDGTVTQLAAIDGAAVQGATLKANKSQKFTLHLKDADGRENKFPPDIRMSVVENRRPDLKLAFPGKDRPVSPLEEMMVEAKVSDDYGLDSFGVIYSLVGQDEQTVKLGEAAEPKIKHTATHEISLEQLKAEPDQLVSYYFFADDRGPDGAVRRTLSDMYFAEVRQFEQIFRQGQQQAGGGQQQQRQQDQQGQQQGQQGQQAQKLGQVGQLQKQIMTATWNLARRPSLDMAEAEGLTKAKADATVLSDSQETARQQVQELAGEMEDPDMQAIAADLDRDMASAVEKLNAFEDTPTPETLKDALQMEQRAYQRLLQLRAKEFDVQRQQQQQQQQGQQGQQGNNRQQQQLNQLELDNKQNRYEQQSQAQQQQEQQATVDQEQLRTLNRLRELARRQEAINEKLKQLESELRQAKSEEEREEIERQLKRLRDEQQQMLRDIDETAEDIDQQQENLDQSAEMQQQAQQARENALKTSEALKENQLSRAISEGTRTERELKELRDDFRKETASEFEDVMRQMRQEARDVEQQQKDIGKQLADNQDSKSLRYAEQRKELEEKLQQQAERVEDLSETMREIVKQSEDTEPLLARTLYDAARELKDKPPEKDLEAEKFLVSRGFMDQAREADKEALKGIEKLREGIEKSADTVLGNELDGLRRAQQEMDRLRDQLGDELARNDPNQARDQEGNRERNGQRGQQNRQDGERQQRDGEPRDGEPRDDEQNGRQGERQRREGQQQRGDREGQQREGQQRNGRQQDREGQREGQQPGQGQGQDREQQPREGEPREGQQQGQQPGQGQNGQRQQGEQQEGQQREGQPREGQQQQEGQQNGRGQQQGQGGRGQRQDGEPREGQQREGQREPRDGEPREGEPRDGEPRDGEPREGQQRGQRDGQQRRGGLRNIGRETNGGGGGGQPQYAPLTGDEYRDWTDRLRDVEEMLDDPELRADVARVRDRARGVRVDLKRHSKKPQWDLVRKDILQPMVELQQRIDEEIAKRESKDSLVPIDRDPVPNRYAEMVRRYYEQLGSTEGRQQKPPRRSKAKAGE